MKRSEKEWFGLFCSTTQKTIKLCEFTYNVTAKLIRMVIRSKS